MDAYSHGRCSDRFGDELYLWVRVRLVIDCRWSHGHPDADVDAGRRYRGAYVRRSEMRMPV